MLSAPGSTVVEPSPGKPSDKPNVEKHSYRLSKSVTADLIFTGGIPTPRELDILKQYIELAKLALEDQNSASPNKT